jgi:glycogen operon protein
VNDVLARLAGAAGIEPGYWDGLGTWRELEASTAEALLRAMGFDVDGDLDAQYRAVENSAFTAPLPPAMVVRAGTFPSIPVALSSKQRVAWELTLESGERLTGVQDIAALERIDERDVDGQRRVRVRLPLPIPLGPGYHMLRLIEPSAATTTLIAAPERCFIPARLAAGARTWGVAVQLYALRSERNWGIGDFSDLAVLASAAGRAGAGFVGLNPLHAVHLADPERASPYSPSSRRFLNPLYIDVEAVAEFADCAAARDAAHEPAFRARLDAARGTHLVDYTSVTALKLAILELLFRHFDASAGPRADAFRAFMRSGGNALAGFARFEAYRLQHRGEVPPADSEALLRFESKAERQIRFQMYLQWLAAQQLRAAEMAASSAGMAIGLYCDLAVGAAGDSAECWSARGLAVINANVGAPPDLLRREGQDWGLPPWNPRALEARAFRPFVELLAASMDYAGALRIDHVMALMRLFWIPAGLTGAHGAYVRNPFETLIAIVALESLRKRCIVIGEDLGSVPPGLRERLQAAGVLSYRVVRFERHWDGDGSFRRPWEYPAQSLATPVTHDMPTIAEFWRGGDIDRWADLGFDSSPERLESERERRAGEREGILSLLAEIGQAPADPADVAAITQALHAATARTASMLAAVQLDDVIGESEPVNIPGTNREYPNWRRKLGLTLEEILVDPRWRHLAEIMRAAGR